MNKKIKAFKGFDENLKCRDFQYEVGKTYTHNGDVVRCAKGGFHSCTYPLDIFNYYPPNSRFCAVTASGKTATDDNDTKIASAKITIDAEIKLPEIIKISIEWIMSKVDSSGGCVEDKDSSHASNTGKYSAASNTGDQSAASNTGDQSAASNTGYQSAASNTGDQSAASNTGNYSAASVDGKDSVAIASGYKSKAKATKGSAIVLVYRNEYCELIHIKAAIAGKEVEPNVWYELDESGEFKKLD